MGTGYVGLVSGACFAEMGTDVTCVDIDTLKIENLKKKALIRFMNQGWKILWNRNVKANRLHFTNELTDVLDDVQIVFSAVGTPPNEDGSADLKYVLEVAVLLVNT